MRENWKIRSSYFLFEGSYSLFQSLHFLTICILFVLCYLEMWLYLFTFRTYPLVYFWENLRRKYVCFEMKIRYLISFYLILVNLILTRHVNWTRNHNWRYVWYDQVESKWKGLFPNYKICLYKGFFKSIWNDRATISIKNMLIWKESLCY